MLILFVCSVSYFRVFLYVSESEEDARVYMERKRHVIPIDYKENVKTKKLDRQALMMALAEEIVLIEDDELGQPNDALEIDVARGINAEIEIGESAANASGQMDEAIQLVDITETDAIADVAGDMENDIEMGESAVNGPGQMIDTVELVGIIETDAIDDVAGGMEDDIEMGESAVNGKLNDAVGANAIDAKIDGAPVEINVDAMERDAANGNSASAVIDHIEIVAAELNEGETTKIDQLNDGPSTSAAINNIEIVAAESNEGKIDQLNYGASTSAKNNFEHVAIKLEQAKKTIRGLFDRMGVQEVDESDEEEELNVTFQEDRFSDADEETLQYDPEFVLKHGFTTNVRFCLFFIKACSLTSRNIQNIHSIPG